MCCLCCACCLYCLSFTLPVLPVLPSLPVLPMLPLLPVLCPRCAVHCLPVRSALSCVLPVLVVRLLPARPLSARLHMRCLNMCFVCACMFACVRACVCAGMPPALVERKTSRIFDRKGRNWQQVIYMYIHIYNALHAHTHNIYIYTQDKYAKQLAADVRRAV